MTLAVDALIDPAWAVGFSDKIPFQTPRSVVGVCHALRDGSKQTCRTVHCSHYTNIIPCGWCSLWEGPMAKQSSIRPRKRRGNGLVEVKVLPKDPLLARTRNLWPIKAKLNCTASDGPTSARIAVVDYNADLDTRFAPAKLLKDGSGFHGIARSLEWQNSREFQFSPG